MKIVIIEGPIKILLIMLLEEISTMKIGYKIQHYRINHHYSQEQLAEHLQVSRQTISNWENNKSYPDIHNLLLMTDLFHISLDDLIKEDLPQMINTVEKYQRHTFKKTSIIFAILIFIMIISAIPLFKYLGLIGNLIWFIGIVLPTFYYAYKVEKDKKKYQIKTYKSIKNFVEGQSLSTTEKIQETAKAPYQKIIVVITCALLTAIIMLISVYIFF